MRLDKQGGGALEMVDYGKRRLLTCADSLRELAKSLDGEFCSPGRDREGILLERGQWENRQALRENLQEMAQVMTRVASEAFRVRPMEERKRRLVCHFLKAEGILARNLFYIERAEQRTSIGLTMSLPKGGTMKSEDVAALLSVVLNKRLVMSVASPDLVDEAERSFVLTQEAPFVVMTGAARAVKENEDSSGDNYAFIESDCGKFTMLLSDGTGSGEKAGRDSGRILDLMEKMIEAEFDLESAVNLVNSAVLAQGREQGLSTLDICSLDLFEGSCEFHKVGAAASFVKRDYLVEQIDSHCLPLGVFQSVEPEIISCELMDGDYIIMMTDGVLDALGQKHYEAAMKSMIAKMQEQNPKEMAKKLLQFVLRASGGRVLDDMTILVLGLWEHGNSL